MSEHLLFQIQLREWAFSSSGWMGSTWSLREQQHQSSALFVVAVQSLSCDGSFVTPWTVALQAPLSVEFSRQEYWSGLTFPPPPGGLPDAGIKPTSPALAGVFFTAEPPEKHSAILETNQKEIFFLKICLFFLLIWYVCVNCLMEMSQICGQVSTSDLGYRRSHVGLPTLCGPFFFSYMCICSTKICSRLLCYFSVVVSLHSRGRQLKCDKHELDVSAAVTKKHRLVGLCALPPPGDTWVSPPPSTWRYLVDACLSFSFNIVSSRDQAGSHVLGSRRICYLSLLFKLQIICQIAV